MSRAIEIVNGTLKCAKCGEVKPVSEFSKGNNKSGYKSYCKQCVHADYLANKDHILKQHKEYYEDNKGKYLQMCKEYRDTHKEDRREYFKEYYQKHSEELREKSCIRFKNATSEQLAKRKAYAHSLYGTEDFKAYKRMKFHYRKAMIQKLPNDFTNEQWEEVKARFGYRCAYCGKEKTLTQDHVVPVIKGGGYTKTNIVPCCGSCNSSKQDKDFEKWYKTTPFFDKERLSNVLKVMEG